MRQCQAHWTLWESDTACKVALGGPDFREVEASTYIATLEFFLIYFTFMYMDVFASMRVCVPQACPPDRLALGLWMAVSQHVCAGNLTWVLCKNTCS